MPRAVMKKYKEMLPTLFDANYPLYNIMVYPLPHQADETFLKKLFENFGKVETAVIVARDYSPASYGGFVSMYNPEESRKAIIGLNGLKVFDTQLEVASLSEKEKVQLFKRDEEVREKILEDEKLRKYDEKKNK